MTVKEFFDVAEIPTSFCLYIGNGQEVNIGQEDTALVEAFGDIEIDKIVLPVQPCGVNAKTIPVRKGAAV